MSPIPSKGLSLPIEQASYAPDQHGSDEWPKLKNLLAIETFEKKKTRYIKDSYNRDCVKFYPNNK